MSTKGKTSREMNVTEKLTALFDGLEECDEDEQRQKILEINEMISEMNEDEYLSVFTKEPFNKIDKMIEKEKISLENAIEFLKFIGYYKMLRSLIDMAFYCSFLNDRFKKMIINENEKKDEKNEKLLADLCECYISLNFNFEPELLSICVSCLLKVALKKDENEETQKEVEMALLALGNSGHNV
eukprot:MONOS_703.1-p1 / transcript=MONOS_703.1 / gene=MONOS_703 / organism=Monocercomonoides_exilis_PA203 / gene_product=unspecified product / transcript_product=unspecified product / location=Mono_scaffold00011:252898-253649(-) / protein_length=184 / sequence_SO=supercontig / SO=protein_coding / is_pseudo=false